MKNDVHLIGSKSPTIVSGIDRIAFCGKVVPKSKNAYIFDEMEIGDDFKEAAKWIKGLCPKCVESIGTERYVYGILAGKGKSE